MTTARFTDDNGAVRLEGALSGSVPATSIGGVTVTGTPSAGQVLTATSATAADWEAGGGGGGAVLLATTTLSAAQILSLGTVAVPVTPTPAPGQGQMVMQVWSAYHFVTTPYSGTDALRVTPNYRGGTAPFVATVPQVLSYMFDAVVWWDQSGRYTQAPIEYDHSDLLGSPWSVMCDDDSAPPTLGDSTMSIYCTYSVFTP